MAPQKRQMHLGVFVLGTGCHSAGWRYEGAFTTGLSISVMQNIARIAERGKFDLFFISDGLVMDPGDHPSFLNRFEPLTLLSALSMVTRHIGLGATVSTSFNEPFNVARAIASLDHISNGRAGWNVVTSANDLAALNFSQDRLNEHELRYEIATEFVDIVRALWDCWNDGAIVADQATGIFLDKSKVHRLEHKGRFFSVRGPLNMARCPQGHPIIIQAGGSPAGQELSARSADLVFSVVNGDPVAGKANYDSLKQRVIRNGRRPDQLSILPGVMPIIGETDSEAKEQLAKLQSCRAGAGKFRGGAPFKRDYRLREEDAVLQVRSDRRDHRPFGLYGGSPGQPSENFLNPNAENRALPSKFTMMIKRGDVFRHVLAGAGGWGDPLERDPAAVLRDVRNELLSPNKAAADYGS